MCCFMRVEIRWSRPIELIPNSPCWVGSQTRLSMCAIGCHSPAQYTPKPSFLCQKLLQLGQGLLRIPTQPAHRLGTSVYQQVLQIGPAYLQIQLSYTNGCCTLVRRPWEPFSGPPPDPALKSTCGCCYPSCPSPYLYHEVLQPKQEDPLRVPSRPTLSPGLCMVARDQ